MATKTKKPPRANQQPAREIETEPNGKLSAAEAEAIMSADLPSGDPELTPPAPAADVSPDYPESKKGKAA
jgi:hypothetical protein